MVSDSSLKLLDLLTQNFKLLHLGEVHVISLRASGVQPYGLYSQQVFRSIRYQVVFSLKLSHLQNFTLIIAIID